MQFSIKLEQSNSEIKQIIIDAIIPEINKLLDIAAINIRALLPKIVERSIKDSPEYQSLVDNAGKLRGALGVVNSVEAMNRIIDVWTSDVFLSVNRCRNIGGRIRGGLTVEMIKGDYADVLNLEVSKFVSENDYLIPWLEWLLLAGKTRVVQNYKIIYGPSKFSRTGLAIMKKETGASFSVPGEFSGNITNNFVTRALTRAEPEILNLIEREFD